MTGVDFAGHAGLLAVGLIATAGLTAATDLEAIAGLRVGFEGTGDDTEDLDAEDLTGSDGFTVTVVPAVVGFATPAGFKAGTCFDWSDGFAAGCLVLALLPATFLGGFTDTAFKAGFFIAAGLAFTNGPLFC